MDVPWRTTSTVGAFLEELAFADEKLEFFEGKSIAFVGSSIAYGRRRSSLSRMGDSS